MRQQTPSPVHTGGCPRYDDDVGWEIAALAWALRLRRESASRRSSVGRAKGCRRCSCDVEKAKEEDDDGRGRGTHGLKSPLVPVVVVVPGTWY